jgi:[ribosomal protein S18]-alanine N-acetyltransferase
VDGDVTNIQDRPFFVDGMKLEDIPEVLLIDAEAFPIPWPEQAYRHELLENRNGYFIVVRARHALDHAGNGRQPPAPGILQRLAARATRVVSNPKSPLTVIGFAGMWMFVDEAHISTIASHVDWRGKGVGELMLVSILREAQRRNSIFATLEVRVTNFVAQNLYHKYGFVEVGRRKRYYRDNGEDALIMTVQDFTLPAYTARLDELEQALLQKLAQRSSEQKTM